MPTKKEKASFSFYEVCGKIFCRIKSDYAQELNKEIVILVIRILKLIFVNDLGKEFISSIVTQNR